MAEIDSCSSSSFDSRDSDSETAADSEPRIAFDETGIEEQVDFSCMDSKRRRLDEIDDYFRLGPPHWPAAARRAAASEGTLIVLDWDDTLLPSTWLLQQGLTIAANSPLPSEEQRRDLRTAARCVIRVLRRAKRLGHVIIVTNAEKGWVELSSRKFLPEVSPLLEGIMITSARSTFEPAHPESPLQWKRLAFQRHIGEFFQTTSRYTGTEARKNMISVGDSRQERAALFAATQGRDCWTKSLKLMERPSMEQFVKQHDMLHACLRPFADFRGTLDLCLQVPS
jgi:hypothetical protein